MSENITFRDFPLNEDIQRGLADMGYERPTPVQAAAIPEVIKGKDLLVQAKTGSGKTLGFGLGVLQRIDPNNFDVQALVIVPTRELAIQVAEELSRAGAHMRLMVGAIYGGTKMDTQYTDLEWSQIIVGTRGRLRDHLTRGNLYLESCRIVVLDEADEMLDMGFKDDLEFLLAALPKERQSLLFSATFPAPIEAIARRYMKNPEKIAISTGLTTPVDIKHRFIKTSESQKMDTLVKLLKLEDPHLGIIFCKRKSETAVVARRLRQAGLRATYINGDMNQAQRIAALEQFKRGEVNLLVATDVAARGLDISGITHVINMQVPDTTETYVHRSGRTGRAGKKGTAITLVTPEEERDFLRVQRDLREGLLKNAQAAAVSPAQAASAQAAPVARSEARPVRSGVERVERPAERSVATGSGRRESARHRVLTAQEVIRWGSNRQAYLAMAQELLRQGHPEQIIASLLSLVPQAQGFLPAKGPVGSEEGRVKADPGEERHGRRRRVPERTRTQRKPSQVVYSE